MLFVVQFEGLDPEEDAEVYFTDRSISHRRHLKI